MSIGLKIIITKKCNAAFKSVLYGFIGCVMLIVGYKSTAAAQTMTLSAPSSNGNAIPNMAVVFSISGETGTISNVRIIMTYISGWKTANIGRVDSLTMFSISATQSFSFNPSTVGTSALFRAVSSQSLPDGVYSVRVRYTRGANGATVSSNLANSVTVDTQALPPSIFTPATNSTIKGIFNYRDSIPENYANASKTLTFLSTTGISTVVTLDNGVRNSNINFNIANIGGSGITSTTASSIPDGTYQLSLAYRDLRNFNSVPVSRFVTFDSKTLAPVIIRPTSSVTQNNLLDMVVNIPEQPSSGTAKLLFKKSGGGTDSLVFTTPSLGTNIFNLNLKNISSSTGVASSSTNSLGDGQYDLIFKYADFLGNGSASDTISGFTIDNTTLPLAISSPTDSLLIRSGDPINLNFTLPEQPKEGSVKLLMSKTGISNAIVLNSSSAGAQSFVLNSSNMSSSSGVLSSSSNYIEDGTYNLRVSYQDNLGNQADTTSAMSLIIDRQTLPLTIVSPSDSTTISGTMSLSFNLPELAKDNQVQLSFIGCENVTMNLQTNGTGLQTYSVNGNNLLSSIGISNTSKSTIPNGNYMMTISYQDILGNVKRENLLSSLNITNVLPSPVIVVDSIAPQCGLTTADLYTGIKSNITGLQIDFYSDVALTIPVNNVVSISGTYYVKATNVNNLYTSAPIILNSFTICPEIVDVFGRPTTDPNGGLNKNGKKGRGESVNKNGKVINNQQ